MKIGIIKWFDFEKGFGVVSTTENGFEILQSHNVAHIPSGNEVFLHIKNWTDKSTLDISRLVPVVFDIAFERHKITAKDCKYFSNSRENWSCLFSLLGNTELIRLKEKYSIKEYNIIEYCLKSLVDNFDDTTVSKSLHERLEQISTADLGKGLETIFRVIKNTTNEKLKQLLDGVILNHVKRISVKEKIVLWKTKDIQIQALCNNEILDNEREFNFDDIKVLKSQSENEEIINLLILKKLEDLGSNFDFNDFRKFEELVALINKESLKTRVQKDLNIIAQTQYLKFFFNNLSIVGKIEDKWDLDKIEKEKSKIPNFLNSEVGAEIRKTIEFYIIENSTIEGLVSACLNDYFSDPDSIILKNQKDLAESTLSMIINSEHPFSTRFKINLLESLSDDASKHPIILKVAKNLDSSEIFKEFDEKIFNLSNDDDYFIYWSQGLGKIIPEKYLLKYFDDDDNKYNEIEHWISRGYFTEDKIKDILFQKLELLINIEDRVQFHTIFNIIQYLTKQYPNIVDLLINNANTFQSLILWYLDLVDNFEYELLKGKFIYFRPQQQVRIIKKLFLLKKKGIYDLTIEKLDKIARADVDLFLTNEKFNPEIILDLSTSIVIESIKKFKKHGKFLVESELLSIVLSEIGLNKTKRFQLSDYFDKCEGRMIGEYNWKRNGEIKKVFFAENQFYFAISFQTGETRWVNNRRGGYETFIPNSNFEELKEAVKKLPGRKWNPDKQHWGVPAKYEAEVIQFAKENRFFLDFDGSNYTNNIHLIEYKRVDRPNGIIFCEGQQAQTEHKINKKAFWWCANQACFENVENIHSTEEWEDFTLLDFLNILGYSTIEKSKYGTFDIGLYNQYISHINRFHQLLEKIYCKECNQILYPVESSNYAAYTVVRFCCENEDCTEYQNNVYLNHCLNGKCNAIIDSRDSEKCPNGLYICQNCGSCCSHAMFTRRLNNLENTGGLIHDDLRIKVENKEGHLERAEYYCHSCGNMMTETSVDTFKCFSCNVVYETDKYRFEREYKTLRRKDYPTGNKNVHEADDMF